MAVSDAAKYAAALFNPLRLRVQTTGPDRDLLLTVADGVSLGDWDGGEADGVLTIPDYSGNRFFNTLGNLAANPKAGLVFVDFATGTLLQMTGDTELVLDGPEIADFPGAERLWRLRR